MAQLQVTATSQVSLGNFGGSSGVSGIVAGFFVDGLHLYNGDGSPVAGWPQPTSNLWYPAPTIDVDGDGIDEIIGYPAQHADGTLVNTSVTIPVKESIGDPPGGSAAVADLDADGQPDFVVANSQRIWASNAQGLLAGFPVPTPNGARDIFFYPVIGDVDGSGKPNIILPTGCPTSPAGTQYLGVNILTNEGVLERTLCTTEPVTNQVVALADLDGDGIPEIIASTGSHVYAWKGDGTPMPGWPASLGAGTLAGPAVVGDVDGGGYPDIVLVSGTYINGALRLGLLHGLDRFGKARPGFPKPIQSVVTATAPVIAIKPAHPEQNGRHERMHLTLKKEATKPAGKNFLQQQARFDAFTRVYNHERPHQALNMRYPAELYRPSTRNYTGLPALEYPFHDRTVIVTQCGRLCFGRRKINLSQVFAGQAVGV